MQYAKHLIFIFLFIGCLAVDAAPQSLVESPNVSPHPLRVGEKLTYNISVKKVPAVQRIDRIVKEELRNGEAIYHIQSTMKPRAFFKFYNFERHDETYLNPKTLSPVRFRSWFRKQKSQTTVTVDFQEGTAEYEKRSRLDPKSPEEREVKVIEIPTGTQDELSRLYFLRSKQLAVGKTYFYPLIKEGKLQEVTLTVERREKVKNKKLGTVETLVLISSTESRFWFTDDERRILVKAEVKTDDSTAKLTLVGIKFTN